MWEDCRTESGMIVQESRAEPSDGIYSSFENHKNQEDEAFEKRASLAPCRTTGSVRHNSPGP